MTSVLLIDDDESNRLTMSALLDDEGFEVREAASFAEARAILSAAPSFEWCWPINTSATALGPSWRPSFARDCLARGSCS